jgi:hypothetical protein
LTAQVVAGQLPHQHQTHHHHHLHPQGQAGSAPATTTTSCNIQTHVYAEQRYACSYRQRLQTASACNCLQKQQLLHNCYLQYTLITGSGQKFDNQSHDQSITLPPPLICVNQAADEHNAPSNGDCLACQCVCVCIISNYR